MSLAAERRPVDLRQALRPFRMKYNGFAVYLFLADFAMYAAATALAASPAPVVLRVFAGFCAGVLLAVLFVIGHDACHGSFTSRTRLNKMLGRIAFLPTMTPYSTWELSHNLTHHVYTNLKPYDHIWRPLSRAEYESLPPWRRKLERIYRHPLGLALYYPVEIWWKRLFFPSTRRIGEWKIITLRIRPWLARIF